MLEKRKMGFKEETLQKAVCYCLEFRSAVFQIFPLSYLTFRRCKKYGLNERQRLVQLKSWNTFITPLKMLISITKDLYFAKSEAPASSLRSSYFNLTAAFGCWSLFEIPSFGYTTLFMIKLLGHFCFFCWLCLLSRNTLPQSSHFI